MSGTLVALERAVAGHVRDPQRNPAPAGIEARRMRIYRELVYNTIEGFLSGGFPVLRTLFEAPDWHARVQRFVATHRCHTPYFLEIGEEFLAWLQQDVEQGSDWPAFATELAHYEWVELALDVADGEIDAPDIDPGGDPLAGIPVLSPLAWPLAYRYPVQRIGREYQPEAPPAEPTCLIVYRNREDEVKFIESNPATLRLLELMRPGTQSGEELVEALAAELGLAAQGLRAPFGETLARLLGLGIVAGTRRPMGER